MPSREKHCQDSLRKYGKRFDDLHSWMDNPRQMLGRQHRMFRHDPKTTPQEAKTLFGEFADHACLDHIQLDMERSDEIARRTMDTDFCAHWEGNESSKYCRKCAQPGEPCYELWKIVCQLAVKQFVFANNRSGAAYGNQYRIESPHGKICYLQMLQGKKSRFALPIEDFLYVTRTGKAGVNETPSKTRQYPFVELILEEIAAEPGGKDLIDAVRIGSRKDEIEGDLAFDESLLLGPAEDFPVETTQPKKEVLADNETKREQQQAVGDSPGICPRCEFPLVWRRAQRTGESYRGCTNFKGGCRYHERSYKRTPSLRSSQEKVKAPDNAPTRPDLVFNTDEDYAGLVGPYDSEFWGPPLETEERQEAIPKTKPEKIEPQEKTKAVLHQEPRQRWLKAATIAFAIAYYPAYFLFCLIVIGSLVTGLSLLISFLAVAFGVPMGQTRYSQVGGYYWTDPITTLGFMVFFFLFIFLFMTSFFLGLPLLTTAFNFVVGLAAAFVIATKILK